MPTLTPDRSTPEISPGVKQKGVKIKERRQRYGVKPTPPKSPRLPERQARARALFRSFVGIAARWNLNTLERVALLGIRPSSKSTYFAWKTTVDAGLAPDLSEDQIHRIAYLLGIYEVAAFLTVP